MRITLFGQKKTDRNKSVRPSSCFLIWPIHPAACGGGEFSGVMLNRRRTPHQKPGLRDRQGSAEAFACLSLRNRLELMLCAFFAIDACSVFVLILLLLF